MFGQAITDPVLMRSRDGSETGRNKKMNLSYADLRKTDLAKINLDNCETDGAIFE